MSDNLNVTRDGYLATITITREKKLNALDNQTCGELQSAVAELSADDGVGAIILTGAGEKAFIAGADIAMLREQGVLDGTGNAHIGQAMTLAIENSPKPVIAAVNGYALGGGLEVALACDMRFCSSNARLGLPEVSLGIIPGYGGTQRLPRLIGSGVALQMILSGDHITAEDALRIGLVNAVFAPDELMAGVQDIARKIVSRGPQAVTLAKQAVRRGCHLPMTEGLALEADLFGLISSTAEMKEGLTAFLEKRKPDWLRA